MLVENIDFDNLNEEQKNAIREVIKAAISIDADLSFNMDNRGLNTRMRTSIESVRVRYLLDSLKALDEAYSKPTTP